MKREGLISIWHDNEILPGDKWRDAIFSNLADSDLLLYLTSAYSLESENCNKEFAAALNAEIRVIPIILEHCDWLNHQLSDFQALPGRGKPINKWQPESDGWQSVVGGIRKAIDKMLLQADPSSGISEEELHAELAFQRGNVLMMLGQLDMAIEAYSKSIDLNPRDANAYYNRGVAYGEKDEVDLALKDYNKAIELKPNFAEAHNNRGIAYNDKGDADIAVEYFDKAIELNPNYAEARNNRGTAYNDKGELDHAIEDYNTAIELKPNYAEAYYNRGNTYVAKGEVNCAITDYTKAIQLKSDYVKAYYNRGNAYFAKGEVNCAITDYTKAIQLKSNYAEAHYNRGVAYSNKGELDLAIGDYNAAIKLDPDYAKAHNNRGLAYSNKGEVDRAINDYNTAIRLHSNYTFAYINRGNAYHKRGEFNFAINDYNKAIQLNPNDADTYYNRGNTYNDNGKVDLAINDYNKAIQLNPDVAGIYCNRGVAYFKKGEMDLAIKDYNYAIKLDPNYVYAYNNRGIVYQNNGEANKAIKDYTTAIRLESKHGMPYYNRGEAWLRLREWDKAKTDLLTAKKNGLDITARFRSGYKNVEAFEQRHRVKLPEDLALLLTQRRRTRYPKMQKVLDADGNSIESPNVVNLRAQLRNIGTPLGEYIKAKPSFGINTAPTEAFVVDKATRDELIEVHPASVDILKPFLHGQDLRRWHVDTPHQWLIFTHRGIAINDYPAILQHLKKYREPLRKRKGKQEWYELPASLGNAERFAQPKLVCPDTYNHQTFAVDTAGYYYGKTSYLIPTEETWLCGLLNSRTVEWFYSQVSNQLTINPLRARSGYIQQIPIPNLTSTQKALIAKIVDYLIYLQQQPTINSKDLAHARDHIMLGYFERIIDGLVYEVYLPEDLHKGDKHFFQPLLEEQLPSCEEIQADKMTTLREIFELLYERTHLVRRNLYYLDSVKAVRIIEGKI